MLAGYLFYCHYRPKRRRSSARPWSTVVPGRVEWGGRRVLSRAGFSLILSILILPHCSGRIPETAALYNVTHLPDTGRGEFTHCKSEIKTEQIPQRTSRTPVELGLKAVG
jgi:hypothetical protein